MNKGPILIYQARHLVELQIDEILEEVGIAYTDIGTHWLLKECPTCGKKDKVRVDKDTGKWICHKCYSDDPENGKGNMWTLLPKFGLDHFEIGKMLRGNILPTYTDDFQFKMPDELFEDDSTQELPEITLPSYFMPLTGSIDNYHQFPEAYGYLLGRGVNNLNLITYYNLKYSTVHKRIIFPFYDKQSRLVGWQGRDITDRWKQDHPRCPNTQCDLKRKYYFKGEGEVPEECPECGTPLQDHFYPKTLTSFGFKKQSLLINQNRINPNKPVVLVEGPFDAINTPNSIPLLGKFLSPLQAQELRQYQEVLLYFDGDDDGSSATKNVYRALELFVPKVGIILNEANEDPGQFNYLENLERIKTPISIENWGFRKKILV